MNPYDRLFELILEKRFSGLDEERRIKTLARRFGKWHGSRNPKAKPGQPGYIRPRNVPPTKGHGSEYDPEVHTAPEPGKPLTYKEPHHDEYASTAIASRLATRAARGAEEVARRPGNVTQNAERARTRFLRLNKLGLGTFRKHGGTETRARRWVMEPGGGKKPHRIIIGKGDKPKEFGSRG